MKRVATLVAAAAAIMAAPASAATYDVAASFNAGNNPSGAFTHGYFDAARTTFTPFTIGTSFEGGKLSALVGPEDAIGVYKNVSGSAFTAFSTVDVPQDALFLHPGPTLFAVVVFTVPTTGIYNFAFQAKLLSNSTITGVQVFDGMLNGNTVQSTGSGSILDALSPTTGNSGSIPFLAGQRPFIAVSPRGSHLFDSTQLSFTLSNTAVPEPASWALFIAGFGLAGAALRRRRSAIAA